MNKKQKILIVTIIIVASAVIIYWYAVLRNAPMAQAPAVPLAQEATTTPQSLGENIYEQSQNPIQDKVPVTQPAVNPIEGVYKNPFQ